MGREVGGEEGRLLTEVKSVQACGSHWLLGGMGGGSCIIAKKRGGDNGRDRAGERERERRTVKYTPDTAVGAPDIAVQPNVHLAAV